MEQACGEDADLRRQVMSLVGAHERAGEFLDVPVVNQVVSSPTETNDGTTAFNSNTEDHGSVGARNERRGPVDAQTESQDINEENTLGFLQSSTKPGSIGRLGRYEVLEVLGQGGFGIVLKGFDERLHPVVAIKVLSPVYAASGVARKRFIREARAAAAVKNEHIVGIHDVQENANPPFLVMEPGGKCPHRGRAPTAAHRLSRRAQPRRGTPLAA